MKNYLNKLSLIVLMFNILLLNVCFGEEIKQTTISFGGDCTLGGQTQSFENTLKNNKNDFNYPFKNVQDIFKKDDFTIVNLEAPITTATKIRTKKTFNFKTNPKITTKILNSGNIDAVHIANNHMNDYGTKGLDDTIKYLKEGNVDFYGYKTLLTKEINGLKYGFIGLEGWSSYSKKDIKNKIDELKKQDVDFIIISFHWGEERFYNPNNLQKELAKYSIDNGADFVVGHHPHVLQSVEKYKDKYIVYSLGNFCFGGNMNPKDKDTIIAQILVNSDKSYELKIIPCSISSVKTKNNYQPTPTNNYSNILKKLKLDKSYLYN